MVVSNFTEVERAQNSVEEAEENALVRLTQGFVLKPYTQHQVLRTTKSNVVLTIESRMLRSCVQRPLSSRGIMDLSRA